VQYSIDMANVLQELARVVRSGGRLVLIVGQYCPVKIFQLRPNTLLLQSI
jgi:ubiquinone/menaquinone biosynthesis C-methylase UbiE